MQLVPRTKVTKAKLGGKSFLYNPPTLRDSQGMTMNEIATPGISYPILGYGRGNTRTISFDIYLTDKKQAGITKSFITHLEQFLPPPKKQGYQFKAPKQITFAYGFLVKDCWLVQMDVEYTAFSPQLEPIEANVSVTLNVIQ